MYVSYQPKNSLMTGLSLAKADSSISSPQSCHLKDYNSTNEVKSKYHEHTQRSNCPHPASHPARMCARYHHQTTHIPRIFQGIPYHPKATLNMTTAALYLTITLRYRSLSLLILANRAMLVKDRHIGSPFLT